MAFLTPDKTYTTGSGLTIKEYLLTAHNPNKISLPTKRTASQPLIGVTLHNTDDINEANGTTDPEQYTRATVNGNMGDVRVHYYVDDIEAWRNLDDSYTSWHAATGGQGQGNINTISIECVMKSQTDAQSLKAMENAAKLIAHIFGQNGWTVEKNLYTHNYWTNYKATGQCSSDLDAQSLKKVSTTAKCFNDSSGYANASGKYCPAFILPQWDKFKALVKKYMGNTTTTTNTTTSTAETMYRVRKTWSDAKSQIGAYKVLDNAKKTADKNPGYTVYDSDGKAVYPVSAAPVKTEPSTTTTTTTTTTADKSAIGDGDIVAIKNGTKTYYPGGIKIPDWVILNSYHKVTQTTVNGKPVTKGGVTCVLLGKAVNKTRFTESEGINSWIEADALTIIRKA